MSDFEIKIGNQQGWECPKCQRVFSPYVNECPYCGANFISTTSTNIDIDAPKNFYLDYKTGDPAEMFIDGKWHKGKIIEGYRYHDGIVTIETEDGQQLWCGQNRTDLYRPL